MSKADYEACQARDEAAFRTAIQGIIGARPAGRHRQRRLPRRGRRRSGAASAWTQIIDKRVDLAVEEVRKETSWANLLQSLANQQKAQELATAVAERVYRSDAIKAALEQLAAGVGNEVGKQIEFASQDAAEPALACLKAFVGARYGETAARAVAGDAGKDIALDPDKGAAEMSSGAVLRESSGGIAGAAVLLMRRQLANMAARVGQRIVGSVLARLVSVVAGGIGLVLIAKDIWDLRNGVLPIIATEMKSKENKDKVQEELAKTFAEQISGHVQEIGAATADRVIEIWRDFRSAHAEALGLAERNAEVQGLPRLAAARRRCRASTRSCRCCWPPRARPGILRRLDDGTLNTAVNTLPAPAMDIARETRSIDAGLKWAALAGDDLPKVVELGLYRRTHARSAEPSRRCSACSRSTTSWPSCGSPPSTAAPATRCSSSTTPTSRTWRAASPRTSCRACRATSPGCRRSRASACCAPSPPTRRRSSRSPSDRVRAGRRRQRRPVGGRRHDAAHEAAASIPAVIARTSGSSPTAASARSCCGRSTRS